MSQKNAGLIIALAIALMTTAALAYVKCPGGTNTLGTYVDPNIFPRFPFSDEYLKRMLVYGDAQQRQWSRNQMQQLNTPLQYKMSDGTVIFADPRNPTRQWCVSGQAQE
jgi:hypothetical protein